jgi:primosomal protein N' (replication factor Y) (superfamily II helicase)
MFVVRVVPIARGIFKDYLTFFSREAISPGTVVPATVRGRRVPSIVLSSRDAREEKLDVRKAGFALKKLSAKPGKKIFRKSFIRAIEDTALWHGVHESVVAFALTSNTLLSGISRVAEYIPPTETEEDEDEDTKARADLVVLQADYAERVRTYRNMAREAFARGNSIVLVCPTVIEAESLKEELSRGIPDRVQLLTGELSQKKLIAAWNNIVTSKEPLLIVGTPVTLSIPRKDIDAIIIERESAKAYRGIQRPYVDIRRAAEAISIHTGARLLLADFPLRVETRYRIETSEAEELARSQIRPGGTSRIEVVDERKKDNEKKGRRIFSAISPDTKKKITSELKKGGRVAVYAARKGIAPLTVCNDCGTPVTDPTTGTPMSLHKTANGNVFISHRSGAILPAQTRCKNCTGWNLVTLGIGVDRVYDELRREFKDAPIHLFTKESAPTHAKAKKLAKEFYAEGGSIAVGTERMLPYLREPVELVVIASIDSMLSLPAWRAHEQTVAILFYLQERAQEAFVVETRKPDTEVMRTLASGNPLDFYRADIEERERYGYPPFSVFIGLTAYGTPAVVEKSRLLIEEKFKDLDLVGPLPAESGMKNQWSAKAVIRIPRGTNAERTRNDAEITWPNAALAERLRDLPPNILVAIDPDEIV